MGIYIKNREQVVGQRKEEGTTGDPILDQELSITALVQTGEGPKPVYEMCGWVEGGIDDAQDEYLKDFPQLEIAGDYTGGRFMLWEVVRKFLGKDTPNYAQEIGDCVSFGAKNAIEYLQAYEIAVKKQAEEWHAIFPPYLYGIGRVQIGRGQVRGDGSLGIWQAKACAQYGAIRSDAEGVPKYAGSVARQWGAGSGPPQKFLDMGSKNKVNLSTALVTTWEQTLQSLANGYPVTIASNVGYSMQPGRDGFHVQNANWGHQMCVIGIVDGDSALGIEPHVCILNSWASVHGDIFDFRDKTVKWPAGTLRVRKKDYLKHLAAQDSFAYSNFDGFPKKEFTIEDIMSWF